jgi:ribosomal protein S18 acetylase RimI-like enzyme
VKQAVKTLKIPVEIELPKMEERKFFNEVDEKPIRKLKELDVKFGNLTDKNVEQFRILNYMNLPVVYSDDFYSRLTTYMRYSKLAYLKDVLIGAISCKEDKYEGEKAVYIMTITILKPYRRYGIGSKLLVQAIEDCAKKNQINYLILHVQCSNESALEFYKAHGFENKERLDDYYTDLDPPHCFVLVKKLN